MNQTLVNGEKTTSNPIREDNSPSVFNLNDKTEEIVGISTENVKMVSDNPKLLEYGIDLSKPLEITEEMAKKMKAKGKKGFWESLKDGAKNAIPFLSTGYEIYKGIKLLATVKKMEKEGFDKLTKDEREQIILFQLEQAEEANRGSSFLGKVGTTLTYLPAFAGEFLITGGLYRVGAAGSKFALSEGLQIAAKKVAEQGVKKAGVKATAAFVAQKTTEVVLGSAVRSVGLSHRALSGYLQRRVENDFEHKVQDENGENIIFGKTLIQESKENKILTAGKAIADNYIETLSEQSGAMFSFAITKPLMKPFAKVPFLKHIANPSSQTQIFMTKAGFNGVFEEWGEERLGGFLRGVINLDNNGKSYGQHVWDSTWPDIEQHGVELLTSLIWGGALANAHAVKNKVSSNIFEKRVQNADKIQDKLFDTTPTRFEKLTAQSLEELELAQGLKIKEKLESIEKLKNEKKISDEAYKTAKQQLILQQAKMIFDKFRIEKQSNLKFNDFKAYINEYNVQVLDIILRKEDSYYLSNHLECIKTQVAADYILAHPNDYINYSILSCVTKYNENFG